MSKEKDKESRTKLLKYVSENYDDIIVEAQGGPYIEIDLIPESKIESGEQLHDLMEVYNSCKERGFDIGMLTRSGYETKSGDGLRMGRLWYFMQETTEEILKDIKINE